MVNFLNTANAFAHKSNVDLRKAKVLFASIGNRALTTIGTKLTLFAFKLSLPIEGIIKKTLFAQFCGGETLQEASLTAQKIYEYGVGVILDYGVEGKSTEEEFDATTQGFQDAILFAKGKPHIPFISIKVTGFARFSLLEKLDKGEALNNTELAEWELVEKRMRKICSTAQQASVMILIDAEETWIQDPIDKLALDMMHEYNQNGKILVFNTYQMYRHDRLAFMKKNIAIAKEKNFVLGAKLVRGAYMEKERTRAESNGYASPIQPDKNSCDNDYNEALKFCLVQHAHCATFIGTHNEQSCMLGAQLMQELQLPNNSNRVYFSQLFGMSDHISFNLGKAGYNVSKYLPYGKVHEVVPYLMRRAQENTSVKGQTGRELSLINQELKRRQNSQE